MAFAHERNASHLVLARVQRRISRWLPWAGASLPEQIARLDPGLDVLVLPSLTRANWKEQFGRVLIEAMACDVIALGARSGAIPEVIGEAGLTFEEGNAEELRAQLQRLLEDVSLRNDLRAKGRQRVTDHYTQAAIARHTVEVYRQLLGQTDLPAVEID